MIFLNRIKQYFTLTRPKVITHPDQTLIKEYILVYGFAALSSLIIVLFGYLIHSQESAIDPLPLWLIAVAASSWYGGLKPGIFSTIIICLGFGYFFLPTPTLENLFLFNNIIQITMLALEGIFVSWIIYRAKNFDEIRMYQKKEINYARLLNLAEQKVARAQEEIKARDEFLSIASHELKSPLTSMLLQIQNALNNIRNVSLANFSVENLMKMLVTVEHQTDRLSKMINDLLNVSLITTGRMQLEPEEVDLVKITRMMVENIPMSMNRENYPITLDSPESAIGKWDKVRIEQVVTNLITNAIKYGNNKPVEVKIQQFDHTVELCVKDHGIGIPTPLQKKIFARFERAVESKDYKGLGVGLYITRQIVSAHKGSISVSSKPDKGSIFTIELPL